MSTLIVFIVALISIVISKSIFKKFFNPLALYAFIWGIILILYELKLIRYVPLTTEAWVIIASCYLLFFAGIITFITARDSYSKQNDNIESQPLFHSQHIVLLKYLIIIMSLIGLFNAIQHWYILIEKFGNIQGVLIQAGIVYRLRTEGEIEGIIPYLYICSYVAIVLAGIYSALKNRISFWAVFAFLMIIIKEIASFGRAGILIGFLSFLISYILTRHSIARKKENKTINKASLIWGLLFVSILFVTSITIVKSFRGTFENYKSSSKALNKLESGMIISPSIYLYASSHVGVLSEYFKQNNESALFGENTFQPVYNFLSKFEITKHPDFYQRGYWIPMWTNTGTYLREIHADFGYLGLFGIPYLLGLITTFFWFRFYEKGNPVDLIVLIYLNLIIAFSFLVMISRTSVWFLSFIMLLVIMLIIRNTSYKVKLDQVQ